MNLIKITDLNLIIFLVAKDHQVKSSKLDGNRSIVYFEDNLQIRADILKFVNGTESINITEYQAVEQRVKTLLYQNKNQKSF
jgi:hypothetical protein